MILQVISEYDKDLKSKHAGQSVAKVPILGVPQKHPSKIIQTVAIFRISLTVCMIWAEKCVMKPYGTLDSSLNFLICHLRRSA
jgi:hypothetical protein